MERHWKTCRQVRVSTGYAKVDPVTYTIEAQKGNPPTTPPVVEAHIAFHHPFAGMERVQTGQSAFICPAFPFSPGWPAKVSQVLVM